MLRSIGATSVTSRPPIRISPFVGSSSPAVIRSTVVLPEPEGPTRTTNSPSAISRSSAWTATVPSSKRFVSPRYSMPAIRPPRDQVAVPERAPLRDPALRRVVDEDDPEPLAVAPLPFEVVEQRPDVVAAHVDALLDRALDGADVLLEERDATRILDDVAAVQLVVEGGAVLGDQQRDVAVVALQAHEQLGQRLRQDRPAHRGVLGVRLHLAVLGVHVLRPVEV